MARVMNRQRLRPRKEFGQHFLHDEGVLQREVVYAELTSRDTVLEIGPGSGNLTSRLLPTAARVVAVEKDRQFEGRLAELGAEYDNLQLVWGDALVVEFPPFDKVVANLPYKIALPLTFRLLEIGFERALLIYQKRLAQRLCARSGEPGYSRISVAIARLAEADLIETVDRSAFFPVPQVDSALVELRPVREPLSVPNEAFFKKTVERLFARRDESLHRVVSGMDGEKMDRADRAAALVALGRRIKDKPVHLLTPREFCWVAWALWKTSRR